MVSSQGWKGQERGLSESQGKFPSHKVSHLEANTPAHRMLVFSLSPQETLCPPPFLFQMQFYQGKHQIGGSERHETPTILASPIPNATIEAGHILAWTFF